MQPNLHKVLTIPVLKMLYQFAKVPSKKKKVICYSTGKMSEGEWNRDDIQEFIKQGK